MRPVLSFQGINLKTRLRAIKCYVWPILFYGAETWTITKSLNHSCPDLVDVDVSQSIENIMDGKHYQRGSIEKGGNRQKNSATIQNEEITISRNLIKHNTSQNCGKEEMQR